MPKCEICGKEIANPDSPGHINSKFHQDALQALQTAEKKPAPKEEPKPEPKKEEAKPEPKKEEPNPTPKKEEKPQEAKPTKPAPKKEDKPKQPKKPKEKKGEGAMASLKKIQSKLAKIGYKDVFDDIALGVGIWGFILTLVSLFVNSIFYFLPVIPGFTWPLITQLARFAGLIYWIIQLCIYISLAIFPIMIKKIGMKIIKKWPKSKFNFIKTEEDLKNLIFLVSYLCMFLFMLSVPVWLWYHFVALIAFTPVMLSGTLQKKFKK